MNPFNRFTEKAQEALQQAQEIAYEKNQSEISSLHLLLALLLSLIHISEPTRPY